MIKAVIFDMDGTIIDSEMMYIDWNKEFFASQGINIAAEDLYGTVGRANRYNEHIYLDIWEKNGVNIDFEEHKRRKKEYYDQHSEIGRQNINYNDIKIPHLDELLKYLKKEGYKMALASSSKMYAIDRVVDDANIRDYFEILVTGEDFEKSKPHPDVYLHVLEALGINAEEAIVIEDSDTGIKSSKAAGIITVALKEDRFGFSQDEADYLIDDLLEVKDIINKINNK